MRRIILPLLTLLLAFFIGCVFVAGVEKFSRPADDASLPTQPQAEVIPTEPAIVTEESNIDSPVNQSPVVQSAVVKFPINGRIIVQAREEPGKFPQMVFISERTGRVLLRSSIQDEYLDNWLLWDPRIEGSHSELRFRTVKSDGLSPMIMSVAVCHGGSDDAFFLTVFSESDGKIRRLNDKPLFANIQGGYYLGYLNKRLGYGLAAWNFRWENSGHYDLHKYDIDIYKLRDRTFQEVLKTKSKKMYDSDKGWGALRELGIRARDQRNGIPLIRELVDVTQ